MKKIIYVYLILLSNSLSAQFLYSLTGNPVNTAGWVLSNNSSVVNDVVVLNNPQGGQAAYVYYDLPVNLTTCSQFTVDFDYLITDRSPGGHADGIAFWYITTPPTGFVQGLGIGVPTPATGVSVYLDTWDNDRNFDNPRVAIRQLQNSSYVEGNNVGAIGMDIIKQAYITDGTWHHCQIKYANNIMTVSMDGAAPIITGNIQINMTGYFGFSSSTGANWSKHSLRNVIISGISIGPPQAMDTSYCVGDNAVPVTATGDSLKWYDVPVGGMPLASAPIPNTQVPGVYEWYVSQTKNGCIESARDTLTVTVNPPSPPPVVADIDYCLHAMAQPLTATGQNLAWYTSQDGAGSTTPIIPATFPSGTITYFVTQSSNGCESEKVPINVNVITVDGTVLPTSETVCIGDEIQLQATGGGSYRWYNMPDFSKASSLDCDTCSNPISTSDVAGEISYYVVITSPEGCLDTLQSTLRYQPPPAITVTPEYSMIKYGSSVRLKAGGGLYYTWAPSASLDYSTQPDPLASPKEPTWYVVTGFDENGCTNTDSGFVDVDFTNPIYLPTVFTPNGDGKNDILKILNMNFLKLLEFQIVNRWGIIVFSSDDPAEGWDGTYKGEPQEAGVYFYVLRAASPNGNQHYLKGDITLIR